ncbi:MAG: type II/IV secretion system protein [Gemmatimonadales bacterium]|nr:type II/IV secretion system protein [Gemmatimonadales bacterium]
MRFTDEWLVATLKGLVAEEDIAVLRAIEDDREASLWAVLVERGLADDVAILDAVAHRFRVPIADVVPPDSRLRDAVPEPLVRRFGVLPVRLTDAHLEVATANPFDIDAEKMLAFASGREVRMVLASPLRIAQGLEALYRPEDVASKLLAGMGEAQVTELAEEEELAVSEDEASRAPIVRMVNLMLRDGIDSRASDVHIEPVEGGVVVRYRIDGVLRQQMKLPKAVGVPFISRIKIMSGLDIANRRKPQDGRARLAVEGQPVDLRVSTLPSAHGEKVVIRILNQRSTLLSLEHLGLFPDERQLVQDMLGFKEGIVLVTGPTGSGKTTTLYSALRMVQGEGVNIVTVEDPVEYRLGENVVQVQVAEKAGLTFAAALRSILRQDPDVVLVGEIRDLETAQTAVQASLTGHLVLSTLHTNDAPSAVTRLVDMGIEAYKIASALRGVVAQRLMRRLCDTCRQPMADAPPPELVPHLPPAAPLWRAVGCPDCQMTGYRGRFSVVEILTVTPEFRRRIGTGVAGGSIYEEARHQGMRSLFESGLRHLLAGHTSVEELLRVTEPPSADSRPAAEAFTPAPVETRRPVSGPKRALRMPAVAIPVPTGEPGELDLGLELLDDLTLAEPAPVGKGCVLLVEDEDQLRRVMKDLLEREGYLVVEARDGVEALEQVDRHAPDLMMLDLNLPTLDGYAVLSQLRSRPQTAALPVIVLTAKGDEDNEVRVFEAGADDFLTKPFRARALSARLEAVLGRRRAS